MSANSTKVSSPGAPGAAPYTPLTLLLYDFFVLKFMSSLIWRCPTRTVTLPFFRAHARARHLDVGVGTGYFLQNAALPPTTSLTLCDLNADCLETARRRLAAQQPTWSVRSVQADILDPDALPRDLEGQFDSISLMFLLHCLPGPQSRKAAVVRNLKRFLRPGGVVFGCTVLGPKSGHQTMLSRWALRRINRKGRMGNLGDTLEGLVGPLNEDFEDVEWFVQGSMLLFVMRRSLV